jgi:hypothetical protein
MSLFSSSSLAEQRGNSGGSLPHMYLQPVIDHTNGALEERENILVCGNPTPSAGLCREKNSMQEGYRGVERFAERFAEVACVMG